MLFRTHIIFGLFLYLLFYSFIESPFVFLFGILLGTLIVDLDSRKSTVGNYFLFRPLQYFMKHRGMFHSIFVAFSLMVFFAVFSVWFAFGFIVGFLGHLFLDSFTKHRVAIFWPFSKRKFGFRLIRSGGIAEMIVFVVLFFLVIFLFFYFFTGWVF